MIFSYKILASQQKGEDALIAGKKEHSLYSKIKIEYLIFFFHLTLLSIYLSAAIYFILKKIEPSKELESWQKISIYIGIALCFLILISILIIQYRNIDKLLDAEEKLGLEISDVKKHKEENKDIEDLIQEGKFKKAQEFCDTEEKQEFFTILFNFAKQYAPEKNLISTFNNLFALGDDVKNEVFMEMLKFFEKDVSQDDYEALKNFIIAQYIISEISNNSFLFQTNYLKDFQKKTKIEICFDKKNKINYIKNNNIRNTEKILLAKDENLINTFKKNKDGIKTFIKSYKIEFSEFNNSCLEFFQKNNKGKFEQRLWAKISEFNDQIDQKFINELKKGIELFLRKDLWLPNEDEKTLSSIKDCLKDQLMNLQGQDPEKALKEFTIEFDKFIQENPTEPRGQKKKIYKFSDIFLKNENKDIKDFCEKYKNQLNENTGQTLFYEFLILLSKHLLEDKNINSLRKNLEEIKKSEAPIIKKSEAPIVNDSNKKNEIFSSEIELTHTPYSLIGSLFSKLIPSKKGLESEIVSF
jgi:hypothetical protein